MKEEVSNINDMTDLRNFLKWNLYNIKTYLLSCARFLFHRIFIRIKKIMKHIVLLISVG